MAPAMSAAAAPSEVDAAQVLPKLWVGSMTAAVGAAIKRLKVSHVISVGSEFPERLGVAVLSNAKAREERIVEGRSSEQRKYLLEGGKKDPFVRLLVAADGEGGSSSSSSPAPGGASDLAQHFDECRMFISEGLAQGGVLVHCTDGLSLGPAVAAAFLMMRKKMSVGAAIVALKEKRPAVDIEASLVEQLRALESRLGVAPASPRTADAAGLNRAKKPSSGSAGAVATGADGASAGGADGVGVGFGSGATDASVSGSGRGGEVRVRAEEAFVNPRVLLEVAIDGDNAGTLVFELLADRAPRTAENFRCLCTGEKGRSEASGKRLNYLGSVFHRILPGLGCVGGDITMGDGTGGESIFGDVFDDENFDVKHDHPGVLTMANSGPGTNGSQFLICAQAAPHLDGKSVAFGRLESGIEVLAKMMECGDEEGKPSKRIVVMSCGEVAQEGRKVKRAKVVASEVVRVLHILRKHSGMKKATSWRQEKITCSREDAAKLLGDWRKELGTLSAEARRGRFEALAKEHSDCKSAKKGGDLGPFERDMMQKPFEAASFALQVCELSNVVSTKHGEHLILRIA